MKSYRYDAFGNILQETGPSVPGGLTYTSRQYHSRSGLYYYRARFYDPELGRFLTPDPIGHLGGVNLYAYVGNSPVDFVDPLGLVGLGVLGTESTEAGLVFLGAGQTGALGGGLFFGGKEGLNLGGLASWGGFIGGPGYGKSCPKGDNNVVGGAFAGAGVSFFLTNATSAKQLEGSSRPLMFNIGAPYEPWIRFTVQVSYTNGIMFVAVGPPLTGLGAGISGSAYNTYTWTTNNTVDEE